MWCKLRLLVSYCNKERCRAGASAAAGLYLEKAPAQEHARDGLVVSTATMADAAALVREAAAAAGDSPAAVVSAVLEGEIVPAQDLGHAGEELAAQLGGRAPSRDASHPLVAPAAHSGAGLARAEAPSSAPASTAGGYRWGSNCRRRICRWHANCAGQCRNVRAGCTRHAVGFW